MKPLRFGTNKDGFTLIEVLLGTMLFGIIALSVYMVFSQGIRVEKRLRQVSGEGLDILGTVQEISADLQDMAFYTISESGELHLDARHDRITFLTAQQDGLKEIQYALSEPELVQIHREQVVRDAGTVKDVVTAAVTQQQQRHYHLVRRTRSFFKKVSGDFDTEEILNRHIEQNGLKFFYLWQDEEGLQVWENQWSREGRPLAVRFELTVFNDQQEPVRLVRDVFTGFGVSSGGGGL